MIADFINKSPEAFALIMVVSVVALAGWAWIEFVAKPRMK